MYYIGISMTLYMNKIQLCLQATKVIVIHLAYLILRQKCSAFKRPMSVLQYNFDDLV